MSPLLTNFHFLVDPMKQLSGNWNHSKFQWKLLLSTNQLLLHALSDHVTTQVSRSLTLALSFFLYSNHIPMSQDSLTNTYPDSSANKWHHEVYSSQVKGLSPIKLPLLHMPMQIQASDISDWPSWTGNPRSPFPNSLIASLSCSTQRNTWLILQFIINC